MKGRAKASREKIIILAHQIEAMARQKRLPDLDKLLGSKPKRRGTDAGVFSALERAASKGLVTIRERAN